VDIDLEYLARQQLTFRTTVAPAVKLESTLEVLEHLFGCNDSTTIKDSMVNYALLPKLESRGLAKHNKSITWSSTVDDLELGSVIKFKDSMKDSTDSSAIEDFKDSMNDSTNSTMGEDTITALRSADDDEQATTDKGLVGTEWCLGVHLG